MENGRPVRSSVLREERNLPAGAADRPAPAVKAAIIAFEVCVIVQIFWLRVAGYQLPEGGVGLLAVADLRVDFGEDLISSFWSDDFTGNFPVSVSVVDAVTPRTDVDRRQFAVDHGFPKRESKLWLGVRDGDFGLHPDRHSAAYVHVILRSLWYVIRCCHQRDLLSYPQ